MAGQGLLLLPVPSPSPLLPIPDSPTLEAHSQLDDEFANSLLPGGGLAGLRERLLEAQVGPRPAGNY